MNINRTACATQRRAGNERMGRIVSTLIQACHFSLQDGDYWRSRWNYEEAVLELEYLGTQEESEEFDEFLRNAAGYLNPSAPICY